MNGWQKAIVSMIPMLLMAIPGNEDTFAQSQKRVDLQHADSLIGTMIDGEPARELAGNVHFIQENVQVWCDRATQFMETGKVLLNGNVLVRDDSVTLRSPRGTYYQDERRAEGFDGVVLDDGDMLLTSREGEYFVDEKKAFFREDVVVRQRNTTILSDSLYYYRPEGRSLAMGNVRVVDRGQNMTISGGELEHWSEDQFSRMKGDPFLVQYDTLAGGQIDTLVVRSRLMESYRGDERRLLAIDSVRIVRSDLASIAGLASFFPEGDSILLRTLPVIWYGQTQVTGDSINISMKENLLEKVNILGNAFAVSRTDSFGLIRYDQMTGEEMFMTFTDRKLQMVELERRATSLYHLYEDSLASGLNKTSGDRIVILFDKGKVGTITVSGGVEGQYFPETLVLGNESTYHLAGFIWRDDRPVIEKAQEVVESP